MTEPSSIITQVERAGLPRKRAWLGKESGKSTRIVRAHLHPPFSLTSSFPERPEAYACAAFRGADFFPIRSDLWPTSAQIRPSLRHLAASGGRLTLRAQACGESAARIALSSASARNGLASSGASGAVRLTASVSL